ncbi:hypothetical protein D3C85_1131420 [compost metagenome]
MRTRVERGEIADEPQRLDHFIARILDRELQLAGPGATLARRLAKAVAGIANRFQHPTQNRIHIALVDKFATQLDDLHRVLDAHWANLGAGAATAAGPQCFSWDQVVDVGGVVPFGQQAQVEDQIAWAQWITAGTRRANIVTATALGAGVQVQQVAPGEVVYAADADGRIFGYGRQTGDVQRVAHQQRTQCGDHVLALGPGYCGDETQRQHSVQPPVDPANQ